MSQIDHKRIAGNTLLLYFRMGLIMIVSLWTSRVVLHSLGVVDFGLFNVVGGIVVAFSFMSGALNSACNRYLSTALGCNNNHSLHTVFSANLHIFIRFAAIILLLCETLGLWFLKEKMNIPSERENACLLVYQFSVISFTIGLLSIPYKALVTSKEKMKVYAYSSIIEALLKLAIVWLLDKTNLDRLAFYAFLYMIVSIGANLFFVLYCRHFWAECRHNLERNKPLEREILAFNGWGMIGSLATVLRSQGVNIILNIFFGPAVNAARGVANQVYINIYQFVQNYALAFSPQIYKSYSAGEKKDCINLIFRTSRLSFYLLFMIALPLINEMEFIMRLWLTDVPEHSVVFAQIMLLTALVDSLHTPLFNGIQASGKVKCLNLLVGGCQISVVVLSYIVLKIWHIRPETIFWFIFSGAVLSQILRVVLAKKQIKLPVKSYLLKVILPVSVLFVIGFTVESLMLKLMTQGLARLLLSIFVSLCLCSIAFLLTKNLNAYDRS